MFNITTEQVYSPTIQEASCLKSFSKINSSFSDAGFKLSSSRMNGTPTAVKEVQAKMGASTWLTQAPRGAQVMCAQVLYFCQ